AEFEERHGRAFLLLSAADLSTPRPTITEVRLDGDSPARADSTASLSLVVYALRRNGRSASHLITLGRADDNDVVVPDVSISRFHAFVKQGASGGWLMQDAGSTNGTTVNGSSVPRQGHGPAVELSPGGAWVRSSSRSSTARRSSRSRCASSADAHFSEKLIAISVL